MKIITFVMAVTLATTAVPVFAQVDYDSVRRVQDFVEELTQDTSSRWSIHEEEDAFTRETRRYVTGFGEQGLLFIVASCDAVSVLFRSSGTFAHGTFESIWDDGGIVEYQFDDRDSLLVSDDTDLLRRLVEHDELRVRVRAYPETVVSDEFDFQNARIPGDSELGTSATEVPHVRDLFSEIGCAFE
jgi:hypothetical protein